MLAGLKHDNLPGIYDYFTDAGRWYVVMEFIEGETLETYLNNIKVSLAGTSVDRLPLEKTLAIGIQLCTVLDYLHTRQPPIIFRDLKPANVMLNSDGHVYLIDFGIARHFKPGQAKDTIALGSPGYAAPEQYGKAQTTPRSDIYSLGALLHHMLTGNDPSFTPFRFGPLQLQGSPGIPPMQEAALETQIMQMLDMDASNRPANMAFVKLELERKGQLVHADVTPQAGVAESGETIYQVGVAVLDPTSYRRVSISDGVRDAFVMTGERTQETIGVVGKLFSGRVSVRQLQGAVGISRAAGEAVRKGPLAVISLMVLISVNLGILNLLPIPILDGGNILLLTLEGIRRRDFSMAFKERFVQVGFVFLLVLFAYVMYNDVVRMLPTHS